MLNHFFARFTLLGVLVLYGLHEVLAMQKARWVRQLRGPANR